MAWNTTRESKEVWRVSIEGDAPRDFETLADARDWLDWNENCTDGAGVLEAIVTATNETPSPGHGAEGLTKEARADLSA